MKQFRTTLLSTFVLVASLTGQHASAQTFNANPANRIEYIGPVEDMIVFELRLQHAGTRPASLLIMDENENEIWSESIYSPIVKRYKFEKSKVNKIRFSIAANGQTLHETFNVSYRTEEKLHVLRAK